MTDTEASSQLVSVTGIQKSFAGVLAVRDASVTIRAGEIHGLCGHNGAGKSTLIRILSGQLEPDAGTIVLAGKPVQFRNRQQAQRAGISLVDQELSVVPALTVAENLLLGSYQRPFFNVGESRLRRSREILNELGLEHIRLDQFLAELSIGERQLVEIARALSQDASLVVLDEPTATLSEPESRLVYEAVKRVAARGNSVIFVSHRLGEVLDLCDMVTVMRDGEVVGSSPASSLTVDSLILQMLGDVPERLDSHVAPSQGEPVLELVGLSVPGLVNDVSFTARAGTIYALAGQIGSGASDVLRALGGLHSSAQGTMTVGGLEVPFGLPKRAASAGVAFTSNDRKGEGLFLERSVSANLLVTRLSSLSRLGFLSRNTMKAEASRLGQAAQISSKRFTSIMRTLSGGNQQKAFLGRSLENGRNKVLVIDEPTRGVDVGGRAAIHSLLREAANSGLTIVFASTELDEIQDLADVIFTMSKGRIVGEHPRGISDAVLLKEMTTNTTPPENARTDFRMGEMQT